MTKSLTHQELIFSDGIIKGLTAPEAGRKAKYAETTCTTKCHRWVSESLCPDGKRHVLEYINEKRAVIVVKAEVDAVDLLRQLEEMRISDYADIVHAETGCFKLITEWPLIWRQMIDGLEIREIFEKDNDGNKEHVGNLHKIKFVPRAQIMKMFGDHVGIKAFQKQEVHAHLHLHESPDRLTAGRERALNGEHKSLDTGLVIDVAPSLSIDKPDIKRLTAGRTRTVNRAVQQ